MRLGNLHPFLVIGVLFIAATSVLSMCSSEDGASTAPTTETSPQATTPVQQLESRIAALEEALTTGTLPNALILKQYAAQLTQQKPEFTELAHTLVKDAAPGGPTIQKLREEAAKLPAGGASRESMRRFLQLSDPERYNQALLDPINVLADLSGGTLPRILPPQMIGKATPEGDVGESLIGDQRYGQWKTDSQGTSFWEWYGIYSLFSNLIGNNQRYDRRGTSFYPSSRTTPSAPAFRQPGAPRKSYGSGGRRDSSFGSSSGGSRRSGSTTRRSSSYGR